MDKRWQDIISFYSAGHGGVPVDARVSTDPVHAGSGTIGGLSSNDSGWLSITPAAYAQLQGWYANRVKKPDMQDVRALITLIHESIHMRRDGSQGWNHADYIPPTATGLKSWDNEHQAQALAANLVPDALQRFFGVKFNSPLGQSYWKLAKDAVRYWSYGPDPKNPIGPPAQDYQAMQRAQGDYSPYESLLAPTQSMGDQSAYIVSKLRRKA